MARFWLRRGSLSDPNPGGSDRLLVHGRLPLAQNLDGRRTFRAHLRNLTGTADVDRMAVIDWPFAVRVIRISIVLVALGLQLFAAAPAYAGQALAPGQRQGHYNRWFYPSQMPYGALETGSANLHEQAAGGAFLTLPFMGAHYITSLFDHCYPDYQANGRLCRWDGEVVARSVGGPDPGFDWGYAQTPGHQDYLYYDGHDGYDYGLYYEPVAAAAPAASSWRAGRCRRATRA